MACLADYRGGKSRFRDYARAMLEIEERQVTTRAEADEVLAIVEPVRSLCTPCHWLHMADRPWINPALPLQDVSVRQFLLSNVSKRPERPLEFLPALRTLERAIDTLGSFAPADKAVWDGPMLFVKGSRSEYMNQRNKQFQNQHFPNSARFVYCQLLVPS